jgi:hypothetical protein
MIDESPIKYTFSGHESFQCRNLWLKKGFDYITNGNSFTSDDAVVHLGVGKNMVAAIRFWLKAFNIISTKEQVTEFGRKLLSDKGWDPYLEDDASLWLLHYQLVKNNFASTYNIIFNEFRREKIEFTRDTFVAYIKKRASIDSNVSFTQNTVEADFDVFKKMYLSSMDESKNIEDGFSGILCDLNLVKSYKKERSDWVEGKEKIMKYDCYYIENTERSELPAPIFLFSILDNPQYGNSISLQNIEQDINGPGSLFAMNRTGILDKIDEIIEADRDIIYYDQAGVKELQFKKKPNVFSVLTQYYEG